MGTSAKKFFTTEEKESIENAIREAELNTSGEIRVHIENKFKGDVLDRAAYIFNKLGMKKTELRNGVLFYLAIKNRQFAIIGDAGINAVVPENFWENIKELLADHFKEGKFAEGLSKGIIEAGKILNNLVV